MLGYKKIIFKPKYFLYWTVPNTQNSNRVDKSVRHEGCPDHFKNNLKDNGYSGTQYNPSIQEVEAEESKIQSCPQLYNKFTMSLTNETVSKINKILHIYMKIISRTLKISCCAITFLAIHIRMTVQS